MKDKDKIQVDELLNSYLDGELNERESTEVKRLIAHDEHIANRLRELQKCKELLGALPRAKAPAALAVAVKESMERKSLLNHYTKRYEHRAGVRTLFMRRLATAAAMIAIVSVLGLVVFNIVRPQAGERTFIADRDRPGTVPAERTRTVDVAVAEKDEGKIFAWMAGQMRLKLETTEPISSAKVISRAIYDNGLLDFTTPGTGPGKSTYSLRCDKESIVVLLADLKSVWQKSEVKRLAVATAGFGKDMIIDDVSLEQVAAILQQEDMQSRLAMAQDVAVLNKIAKSLPGREALAAIHSQEYEALRVDKPVLTWGRPGTGQPAGESDRKEQVHLTIVVTGIEK